MKKPPRTAKPRKGRPTATPPQALEGAFAVVGRASTPRVHRIVQHLSSRWPACVVDRRAEAEGRACVGVIVTTKGRSDPAARPPLHHYSGKLEKLDAFCAYAVALHATENAAIARMLRKLAVDHGLNLGQVELLALCMTNMGRRAVADTLGVSSNTVKTRVRLLARQLDGPSGKGELVEQLLHAARVSAPVDTSREARARILARRTGVSSAEAARLLKHSRPRGQWAAQYAARIAFWQSLPLELLATPVAELERVPLGVRRFAEEHGCVTFRDVWEQPESCAGWELFDLLQRTVDDNWQVDRAAKQRATDAERRAVLESATFFEAFMRRLRSLEDAREREVIERRIGLRTGAPESLADIALSHGTSKDAVRKHHRRALRHLLGGGLGDAVRAKVLEAWDGGVLPLRTLAQTPWFRSVKHARGRLVLRFILQGALRTPGQLSIYEIDGEPCLAPMSEAALDKVYRGLRETLARLDYPMTRSALRRAVVQASPNAGLASYLFERASKEVIWKGGKQHANARALGLARRKHDATVALLRASPKPMSLRELHAQIGRSAVMPPEVFYFAQGMVGLEQHFPDFDSWRKRLAPRCLAIMRSAPRRQWSAAELLRTLQQKRVALPAGCTAWHLVNVLRRTKGVRYLGRQRVALIDAPMTKRIYVHDAIREILEKRKKPMPFEKLVARLEGSMSVQRSTVRQALGSGGFTCWEGDSWSV